MESEATVRQPTRHRGSAGTKYEVTQSGLMERSLCTNLRSNDVPLNSTDVIYNAIISTRKLNLRHKRCPVEHHYCGGVADQLRSPPIVRTKYFGMSFCRSHQTIHVFLRWNRECGLNTYRSFLCEMLTALHITWRRFSRPMNHVRHALVLKLVKKFVQPLSQSLWISDSESKLWWTYTFVTKAMLWKQQTWDTKQVD